MIDYSARKPGAINHRSPKSAKYLALLSGCQGPAVNLVAKVVWECQEKIPDYLTKEGIKSLKEGFKRDLEQIYRSSYLSKECKFEKKVCREVYQLFKDGQISRHSATCLLISQCLMYNWWYQSDEELELTKKQFEAGLLIPPVLDTSQEVYKGAHHPGEHSLVDCLRLESENIYRYERDHGFPVIRIERIIEGLQELQVMVCSSLSADDYNVPDFVKELVRQFRRVRNMNPQREMNEAQLHPDPENYLMSSRGNNYNAHPDLKGYICRIGGPSSIPTALGSLFRYSSEIAEVHDPDLVDIDRLPISHDFNFDSYELGIGKKNGGKDRYFMYTSPQNTMWQNVATKMIRRAQNLNPYQGYIDQKRGQEPLWDAIDIMGLDSTEYSDHQTILLLEFILRLYNFGPWATKLAKLLQLPIHRKGGRADGEEYLLPPNGSEAGGKLDVALINDAGQVICYLHWYICQVDNAPYTCGDDWTQIFRSKIDPLTFMSMHSIAASFNQIVNPDKTELLSRDGFAGFCRIKVMTSDSGLMPASGIPASTWLKEPAGYRDLSQAVQFLSRAHYLDLLFPTKKDRNRLVDNLVQLWHAEIREAREILIDPYDPHVTSDDCRLAVVKTIPLDIGGLAMDPEDYSYDNIIRSAINGLDRLILNYTPSPTSIAQFIDTRGIPGRFAEHLSSFLKAPLEEILALMVSLKAIYDDYNHTRSYNHKDLKKIMHRMSVLLLDYAADSDGLSRKSTKDRTTTSRDPDIFLDNPAADLVNESLVSVDLSYSTAAILSCLIENPGLSTSGALQSLICITSDLRDYIQKGLIIRYCGYGNQADEAYPSLEVIQDGQRYRVRLWNVDPNRDIPTGNNSFLPLDKLKDPELQEFVSVCRKLLYPSDWTQGLATCNFAINRELKRRIKEKWEKLQKDLQNRQTLSAYEEQLDLMEDLADV